uniref:PIGH n=1 Tax=Ursus americanus TaxID=9643 RepID=A0A452R237_URSAM
MEDEQSFSDICGGRLALQRRYYSSSCREFCLSCPRLSLRSLTAVTCTVWLAAYGLFTLCEHDPLCCHLHHPLRPAWLPPFCQD